MLSFLLNIANDADRAYMSSLYAEYQELMLRIAKKYTPIRADAEDVVSESCLALYRNIATLREKEPLGLCCYIVVTVKRKALDLSIADKRRRDHFISLEAFGDIASAASVEKTVLLQEDLRKVLQAIAQLPEKERLVLRLKSEYCLSCTDIARFAQLSQDSIYKYLSRARAKIRAAVYGEEEGKNHADQ